MIVDDLPDKNGTAPQGPLDYYVQRLQRAVLSQGADAVTVVLTEMRTAMISAATIAESYVPQVARQLGQGWVMDTIDFRSVSIGSSRLQSLLWQLRPEWGANEQLNPQSNQMVLVVVPNGAQHTLGATVLAGQLRYRGISAQLELAVDARGMARLAREQVYAAIMISASMGVSLETLTELVDTARAANPATSILIGGSVLDQTDDIQSATGADLATSDLGTALDYCGLVTLSDTAQAEPQVG